MKAKTKVNFTKKYIDGLAAAEPSKRDTYYDLNTAGLLLRITEHHRKSFYFVRTIEGRGEKLFIGSWPECSIDVARAKCAEHVAKIFRGENPAEQKREEEQSTKTHNVEALINTFVKTELDAKDKWPEAKRLLLKEVALPWRHKNIDRVARSDVKQLLNKIKERAPGTANHTLDSLKAFLNWAVDEEYISINPAAGVQHPAEIKDRDRVLSDAELVELRTLINALPYPTGPFLKILLLTAQRRGEVAAMKWEHLDLKNAVWTQPADNTKNGISHLVPLPRQAVEILAALSHGSKGTFVFSTTDGEIPINGFGKLKVKLDETIADNRRKAGVKADMAEWVLHDIRRTARTFFGSHGITEQVGEAVLNHIETSRSRLSRIYDRHNYLPEKRDALQMFADHIMSLGSNVVPIRSKKRKASAS